MLKVIFKQGTLEENDVLTGLSGSLSIDTDTHQLRIHDGLTVGGHRIPNNITLEALQAKLDGLGIDDIDAVEIALATKISTSQVGANDGVAPLDSDAIVHSAHIPSFTDILVEVADFASLPSTGLSGRIYVTIDNNNIYRWSDGQYVQMLLQPGDTDDVVEGVVNLYITNQRVRNSFSSSSDVTYDPLTGTFTPHHTVSSVNGDVGEVTLTKADFDLGDVENYSFANETESEEAVVTDKYVAPLNANQFLSKVGFIKNNGEWTTPVVGLVSTSVGAGSSQLIYGDTNAGYYGEVSQSDFIYQSDLSTELNLTAGSDFNWSDDMSVFSWLKFAHNGKVLFIPKKPIKYGISWGTIYQNGLVYGVDGDGAFPFMGNAINQMRTVTIGGETYIVRLPTYFMNDPHVHDGQIVTHPNNVEGSEWYDLILRVHTETEFTGDPAYDSYPLGEWEKFSSVDLNVGSNGSAALGSWVQSTPDYGQHEYRTNAGRFSVTTAVHPYDHETHSIYGWRPVLELVA